MNEFSLREDFVGDLENLKDIVIQNGLEGR